MCLRSLEEIGVAGAIVLDLGCGSGILSIAAALLGAARITALDIDPQATKATRQNAADNGVANVITAETGTLEAGALAGEFDLALANISGLALERLAPALAGALKPGGRLVASGFLDDAVRGLKAAFVAAGFSVERVVEDGVWRAIVARREG
jgi:ribosomal protein L11 methyltransferase